MKLLIAATHPPQTVERWNGPAALCACPVADAAAAPADVQAGQLTEKGIEMWAVSARQAWTDSSELAAANACYAALSRRAP